MNWSLLFKVVVSFATALAAVAVLVEVIRRWALQRRILDIPNDRSSHLSPTPRGGGIAITFVTLLGMLLVNIVRPAVPWPLLGVMCASAVAVAFVSAIDDVRSLPVAVRLATHMIAAVVTVVAADSWSTLWIPGLGAIHAGAIGFVIQIVWLVGFINAFNFMDGIDGIAGLTALAACLGWISLAVMLNVPAIATTAPILGGSACGFLIHNWQPARIFMGDVGSAFLGYMLATIPIQASGENPRLLAAGVLMVWPFVFDTAYTLVLRLFRREQLFRAHRSHLYQRLNQTGVSHARVSVFYGVLAVLGIAAGVALIWGQTVLAFAIVTAGATILLCVVHIREKRRWPITPSSAASV